MKKLLLNGVYYSTSISSIKSFCIGVRCLSNLGTRTGILEAKEITKPNIILSIELEEMLLKQI